jgi:tRNA nucleotidyltransferase (CCA-adding enzyme)
LDLPAKDLDVEVFGLSESELMAVLAEFGTPDTVGRSFGIIKMTVGGDDFDFSLPQTRIGTGDGHRDEQVTVDPHLTLAEAARRRDFTWNAMSQDVLTGEVFDPFGGREDLAAGILRATSEEFARDPLRVRRGAQFNARFRTVATEDTVEMSRSLRGAPLSLERVWGEWWKLAVKGVAPSFGLRFLEQVGWLEQELAEMVGCPQDPTWHPEGDLWMHTLAAVDHAAEVAERDGLSDDERAELFFAVLLHDAGKPTTTEFSDGHFRSPMHDAMGRFMVQSFMERVGAPAWLTERVVSLVRHHMWRGPASARAVRRLSRRVSSVAMLARVMECDMMARGSASTVDPLVHRMVEVAEQEQCRDSAPRPLVMGRHLLAVGWTPGPHVGEALRAAFDAQTDGEFDSVEAGVEWVQAHF